MKLKFLVIGCCALFMATAPERPLAESRRIQELYQAAMDQRGRSGLPPQHLDEELCRIAQRWANNMAARGMMYHGGGEQIVAHGYPNADACVRGWINSPGHRVWVLGRQGACGYGCQRGANGQWYYAGVFR